MSGYPLADLVFWWVGGVVCAVWATILVALAGALVAEYVVNKVKALF